MKPTLDPARLDRAVEALHARGDHVAVVRLVEAWAATGAPSLRARLAEGLAFRQLCLPDRAMTRAQEVLEAEPKNPAALRLLAEVFLARGWPTKARKPLSQLQELGLDVAEAWSRAHAEPARAEASPDLERETDPEVWLDRVEALLWSGQQVRARSLLTRARQLWPDHARARHLFWAQEGDFSVAALELTLLLQDAELGEREESEHTETVMVTTRVPAPAPERGFPALFPGAEPGLEPDEPHEVTQTTRLGDMPLGSGSTSGDTQIMLVIRPGQRSAVVDGPTHVRREVTETGAIIERNLDLAAWKAGMGMRAVVPSSDLDDGSSELLEAEDENVVVVTRAEPDEPSEESDSFDAPIEVIEKRPAPPPPGAGSAPAPAPSSAKAPAPVAPRRSRVVVLGALTLAVGLGLAVVLGTLPDSGAARAELVEVLAQQDATALRALQSTLESRAERGQTAAASAVLALKAARWEDFDPDPELRRVVEAALAAPAALNPLDAREARARFALADGDAAAAAAALGDAPLEDAETRVLSARVRLARGAPSEAEALLAELPRAPRYALARAELRLAQARLGDALAELRGIGTHPAARVRLDSLLEQGVPEALLPASDRASLVAPSPDSLPPRLAAAAWATQSLRAARAADVAGVAEAVSAGLAAWPEEPTLLRFKAAEHLAAGRAQESVTALATAARRRPADGALQLARVLALLELDRLEEAAGVLEARTDLPDDEHGALAGLVALARGESPPSLSSSATLALWTNAWRALQGHTAEAGSQLAAAQEALARAEDPFVRRLAVRAEGGALLAAGYARPPRALTAAEIEAFAGRHASDARAQVIVGQVWERAGVPLRAAEAYARATQLGPELAEAWRERARFHATDGSGRAKEAWERYLALAPSGPQAVLVRERLGGSRSP